MAERSRPTWVPWRRDQPRRGAVGGGDPGREPSQGKGRLETGGALEEWRQVVRFPAHSEAARQLVVERVELRRPDRESGQIQVVVSKDPGSPGVGEAALG